MFVGKILLQSSITVDPQASEVSQPIPEKLIIRLPILAIESRLFCS